MQKALDLFSKIRYVRKGDFRFNRRQILRRLALDLRYVDKLHEALAKERFGDALAIPSQHDGKKVVSSRW